MNKDGGFIKIYRSMLSWEWIDEPVTVQVWLYCLLRANYDRQRWHGQIIEPGQFVTSYNHMAKDLGITVRRLRTALNHLESTHEVTRQVTQSATLITIVKWASYQSAGERATRQVTRQVTSDRHTTDTPPTTIEESKEGKERKEDREIKEREYVEGQGAFAGAWYHEPQKNTVDFDSLHEQFAPIKEALMRHEI